MSNLIQAPTCTNVLSVLYETLAHTLLQEHDAALMRKAIQFCIEYDRQSFPCFPREYMAIRYKVLDALLQAKKQANLTSLVKELRAALNLIETASQQLGGYHD